MRRISCFCAAVLMVATIGGCSDHQKRVWKPRSAQENFSIALDSENGDQRRDAVARIAESGYVASEDAFHVLDAVARTDPVEQVRCIAICAFGSYKDARPVATLLSILEARPGSNEVLPGGDDVRWESSRMLLALSRKVALSPDDLARSRDIYIRLLESDSSRSVKLVAAEALGRYLDRAVLKPLVTALRNEDFAIADRCERSLIALTGTTHDYDADAWEAWLATAENPFTDAGRVPATTRPSGPTWFDKQVRAWRRGLKLRNAD